MINKMYSIYDKLEHKYQTPIPFTGDYAEEAAKRYFQTHMNREAGTRIMWAAPEDFELYEIGTWDTISGTFIMLPSGQPKIIQKGVEAYGISNKSTDTL